MTFPESLLALTSRVVFLYVSAYYNLSLVSRFKSFQVAINCLQNYLTDCELLIEFYDIEVSANAKLLMITCVDGDCNGKWWVTSDLITTDYVALNPRHVPV